MTRASESHSGVSIGRRRRRVVVRLDLDRVGEVAERVAQHRGRVRRRSGRAACGCRPRARPDRGSRWSSCHRARRSARTWCACTRARGVTIPSGSSASAVARASSGSSSASVSSGVEAACPRRIGATTRGSASAGWYSAMRRTTSAAVTSALSVRNGCEPCPGVPCTRIFVQNVPFSRDQHREARPCRRRHLEPARLGEHVVGVHGVALVVEQPVGAPGAERLLVGDREVDQRALRAEPAVGEAAERDRLRRGEVEHVDRAAAPHEAVDDLGARTGRGSSRRGSPARRRCGP